jgi:ArsR family transcriptional regulator
MKSTDPDVLLLSALADPTRLSIVRQLGAQPGALCACDFNECCAVSQPTISHHLKVLRDAGVLSSRRDGTNIYYEFAPGFLERFRGLGATLTGLVQLA